MTDAHIHRARLLWFRDKPTGGDDRDAVVFHDDGAMVVADGRILWSGDFSHMPEGYLSLPLQDHRPALVMPGFIDPHIHFPQGQVVASYAGSLLEWLNTYTFIEEQRYGDPAFAGAMATRFLDTMLAHGTTTCVAYASVHKASAEALLEAALARNIRLVSGKVMMDRNAPDALTDTAQSGHDDTTDLIARYHGKGRVEVAITPRFALTSSEAQMEAAGALAKAHPSCLIQTHLSENPAEIDAVMGLYPSAKDYTDVYDRYGLVTSRSLFGHCIHLSDREVARLGEARAVTVFCPTSNLFLGSGLFDLARLSAAGAVPAIATDIGGGTSWSMLKTLDEGYKVLNLQGQRWHPYASFWQATAGNAAAIGKAGIIGTLDAGAEADFIALDARATPAMRLRMETVTTLAEELFVLQTMGDDRAVAGTWVGGVRVHPSS